jgi:hypothetical protein
MRSSARLVAGVRLTVNRCDRTPRSELPPLRFDRRELAIGLLAGWAEFALLRRKLPCDLRLGRPTLTGRLAPRPEPLDVCIN